MNDATIKRGDLVGYIVGMSDYDYGIFLRPGADPGYSIVWGGIWGSPPFKEMRMHKVFPSDGKYASPQIIAEQKRILTTAPAQATQPATPAK